MKNRTIRFDEDAKESAIQRVKALKTINPDLKIMCQKDNAPTWFALLVKNTWLERLAYYEIK